MQDAVFSVVETTRTLTGEKGEETHEVGYVGIYRNGVRILVEWSDSKGATRGLLEEGLLGYSVLRVETLTFRRGEKWGEREVFPERLADLERRLIPFRMKDHPSLDNIWASATHLELDELARAHNIAGAVHGRNYSMVRVDLGSADPCGRWLLAKRLGA